MTADLKGKVALVTGGARDIGRAVAIKLADSGAAVAINYNASGDRAKALVDEITSRGGKAVAIQADVTKSAEVSRLIDETRAQLGGTIDILVNNAGGLI